MTAFMTYYWDVLKNHYVDFKGRASRKDFWMFVLFNFISFFILSLILGLLGRFGSILYSLCSLAVMLPSICMSIRRLHDTSRSGWWLLIFFVPLIGPLVLIVFLLLPSTEGVNRFGN